jgi:hypothetical protein
MSLHIRCAVASPDPSRGRGGPGRLRAPCLAGTPWAFLVSLCIVGHRTTRQVRRWLGGHDRLAQGGLWQAPARRRTHGAGRDAWPARRSIKSFVYNDPAELERADDLVVRRPIAGKNHAD